MVFSGRVAIGGGVSSSSSADAASFVFDAAFDECGAVKEEDGVAFGAAPDCGVDQGKEKGEIKDDVATTGQKHQCNYI